MKKIKDISPVLCMTDPTDIKRVIRNIMDTFMPFRRNEPVPSKTQIVKTDSRRNKTI